jgi:hypothetical protein
MARWHLWSTREHGTLQPPLERAQRLPKGCEISADGGWAELHDKQGLERVFVNLEDAAKAPARRRQAA